MGPHTLLPPPRMLNLRRQFKNPDDAPDTPDSLVTHDPNFHVLLDFPRT
jgi:hypothetical protein